MSSGNLHVGDIILRINLGHTEWVHFGPATHEGKPAVLLTFCPESKYEQSSFIVQGARVINLSGSRPWFVQGFLSKNGKSVQIEQAKAPAIHSPVAIAAD